MPRTLLALLVALAVVAAACGDDTAPEGSDDPPGPDDGVDIDVERGDVMGNTIAGQPQLALVTVAADLRGPTWMGSPPDDDRLFVLFKNKGWVMIIEDGELRDEPFLDIEARLEENGEGEERGRGERGLLSMAFHPDYADNGRFFLWYADDAGIAELVEYRTSEDPYKADPGSRAVLRDYEQSRDHFGGSLFFGPDGYLWHSLGDGGRRRQAADITHPRGGINRFDVSTPGVALAAPDNPWIGEPDAVEDLWAIGFRNPWRTSLDVETGLLYTGDVGQDTIEEISVQPWDAPGLDYGWPTVEGTVCWQAETCDTSGTVVPDIEMRHDDGSCSVIGGEVYRGTAIPELVGTYLYSDFCGGFVRSFRYENGMVVDEQVWFEGVGSVTSFGHDRDGELYVMGTDGFLRKLVRLD